MLAGERLNNLFAFCGEVFREGVGDAPFGDRADGNARASRFMGLFGCEWDFGHNKALRFYGRQKEIADPLNRLEGI